MLENVLDNFFLSLKMVYDRQKYEYFFAKKVYRCACLGEVMTSCFQHGIYALSDIIDEIKESECTQTKKIFCVKCGQHNENVVFTCADHMSVLVLLQSVISVVNYLMKETLLLVYLTVVKLTVMAALINAWRKCTTIIIF